MASFTSKNIGLDCSFEVQEMTEREIMRKFIEYAESELPMPVLTADMIYRIQNRIKK